MPKTTLEYFMERTEKDLDEIKVKLDDLWTFKWKLVGAAMATSVFVSALMNLVFIYIETKK